MKTGKFQFDRKTSGASVRDGLLFLAYGIYIWFSLLYHTFYQKYIGSGTFKYVFLLIILILAVREVLIMKDLHFRQYFRKNWKPLLVCLFGAAMVIKNSMNSGAVAFSIAYIFIFVYVARNISFERIARFTICNTALLLAFVIFSSGIGVIDDYVAFTENRVRHFLGFKYSLLPPTIVFNLTALLVWLHKEKMPWYITVFLLALNLGMYDLTHSRLTCGTALLLLMVSCLFTAFPSFPKRDGVLERLMAASWPAGFFGSLFVINFFRSTAAPLAKVDSAIGGRLELGNESLRTYGLSLFGKNISWVGAGLDSHGRRLSETDAAYNYVDNFYVQVCQHYGVVWTLVFLCLLTYALTRMSRRGDRWTLVIFTILAFHGIIDDLIMYPHFNTFWLMLGACLIADGSECKRFNLDLTEPLPSLL